MKPLDKLQQLKIWKYSLGLVSVLVVIWIGLSYLYFFQSDDAKVVAEVEQQLESIYTDADKVMIDPTISIDTVNQLVKQANQLQSHRTRDLREMVRISTLKYQDLLLFHRMIDSSTKPEKLTKEMLSNIKTTLTKEHYLALMTERNYKNEDEFNEVMDHAFSHVAQVIDNCDSYLKAVAELPDGLQSPEEIENVIEKIKTIEELQPLALQHTNSYVGKKTLEGKIKMISESFDFINQETPLDQPTIEKIFSSEELAQAMSGHEIDPRLLVSLTFDDGPNTEYTTQVLDVLKSFDIKGTFFVMGAYVDDHPEIAKRIVDEGHIIANHTYNHPDLSKSSDEEVLKQIEWAQDSIRDVTGVEAHLFRMPFGAGGKRVVDLAANEGLTSIIWNIDTLDWESHDVDSIVERTWMLLEKNSIILMHDTHQATPDALKIIIPELLERGYTFVDPLQVGYDYRFFAN